MKGKQTQGVLYEDNHLLIVNKRSGTLVQKDKTGDRTVLDIYRNYIAKKYNKKGNVFLHAVHRLDRPTSGCLILARTSKGLERMNKQFAERSVSKEYLLLSKGRPDESRGRLTHFLLKDNKKNKVSLFSKEKKGAKKAILEYELVSYMDGYSLVRVQLMTGRPHQIRAQMASIGLAILGDLKYGADRPLADKSIALHCHKLTFTHPVTKEEKTIIAQPPQLDEWRKFSSNF